MMEKAISLIETASHVIVIGSSLQVYPAASLVTYCSVKAKKWLVDPNAADIGVRHDFKLINLKAIEGIKAVIEEIIL